MTVFQPKFLSDMYIRILTYGAVITKIDQNIIHYYYPDGLDCEAFQASNGDFTVYAAND